MLDGVNDTLEHAHELVALVKPSGADSVHREAVSCKFNLIPFNPFPQSGLKRSSNERVLAFARVLQDAGLVTTVRKTRGDDIDAACGQLAGEVQDRTHADKRMTRAPIKLYRQAIARAEPMPSAAPQQQGAVA